MNKAPKSPDDEQDSSNSTGFLKMQLLKNLRHRKIFSLSAVAILLMLITASCQKQEGIKPEPRDLIIGVYASGTVLPKEQYKLYSLGEGYLKQAYVSENDTFDAGRLLFELEGPEQQSRRALAEKSKEITKAISGPNSPQIREYKTQIETLLERLKVDSLNWLRYKNLQQDGVSTQSELERRKLTYLSTKNELLAAQERLSRLERQQQLELKNAETNLEISQSQEQYLKLKAASAGRVYEVYKKQNELVRRGEAIALLGHTGAHYLSLSVDEQDVAKIKLGQTVYAEIDAFEGKIFEARISKVYPSLNQQDQSFKLEAEFVSPFPAEFVGMGVEANIIISKKEKAICLPAKYVSVADSVFIVSAEEQKPKAIKIKRGESNFDWVEILSGLPENASVVMPPKKK